MFEFEFCASFFTENSAKSNDYANMGLPVISFFKQLRNSKLEKNQCRYCFSLAVMARMNLYPNPIKPAPRTSKKPMHP